MKNIILTAMLLGLLTGVSFAQRGGASMGGNRGMTQIAPSAHPNPIGATPQLGRPNAIGMTPQIVRPNAVPMAPNAQRSTAGGAKPNVGATQKRVEPPDAVVGPNVGQRVLQN